VPASFDNTTRAPFTSNAMARAVAINQLRWAIKITRPSRDRARILVMAGHQNLGLPTDVRRTRIVPKVEFIADLI
jgi:hypothetical protein